MAVNHNIGRLSEDIKREISAALRELKDKRVADSLVTVTHCDLTNDLSYCKVYVSSPDDISEILEGLKSASGFFKKQISSRVKMRKMPELIFVADKGLENYDKISKIIEKLASEKKEFEDID